MRVSNPIPSETPTSFRPKWRYRFLTTAVLLVALMIAGEVGALLARTYYTTPPPTLGPACPSSAQAASWPSPATQEVRYNPPSTEPGPVMVQVGQTLEVQLYGPWSWQLSSPDGSQPLALATPAGYKDAASQDCVWRFTAQQPGVEQLEILGNGMCRGTTASCVGYFFKLEVIVQ